MGGMPIYGGFELDVYKSLLQYFLSLPRPLIPTFHFDLYVAVQSKLVWVWRGEGVSILPACI